MILDLGGGDTSLWFTGSFGSGGGTYTDPAGEFSTLTANSGGGYTRTLTDGTTIDFDSSGHRDVVRRPQRPAHHVRLQRRPAEHHHRPVQQGDHVHLQRRQPPVDQGPAGRLTTFTISGGTLNQVQQADGS